MSFALHPGGACAEAIEARNDARREESAQVAAHYNARAKEQEEREADQARAHAETEFRK